MLHGVCVRRRLLADWVEPRGGSFAMHDARNDESWEPQKPESFRRTTAGLTFTETDKTNGLVERATPALLGFLAGGGLAVLGWYALGLFGR